jgi:hypothetical protein
MFAMEVQVHLGADALAAAFAVAGVCFDLFVDNEYVEGSD